MVTSAWLPGRLPTKAHFSGEHLTACLTAKAHFSAGVSSRRFPSGFPRKPVKTLPSRRYALGWYASWYARNPGCWLLGEILRSVCTADRLKTEPVDFGGPHWWLRLAGRDGNTRFACSGGHPVWASTEQAAQLLAKLSIQRAAQPRVFGTVRACARGPTRFEIQVGAAPAHRFRTTAQK